MKNLLCVLSLLMLIGCSGKEKANQAKVNDPVNVSTTSPAQPAKMASSQPVSKSAPAIGDTKWVYQKRVDTEGHTVYKASITSPMLLQFSFPYAGGSTATLVIRKRDTSTTVYLQVSRGQFNRSFQGGSARIRFDQRPAATYSFSAAANGSATIIFFDSAQALINKLKEAKKTSIDVEFYAQGHRQIAFRTADLNWNH